MNLEYNAKLSKMFYAMTYNEFQLERREEFSKEEIEWALYEINYKYFGSYEFTDQQSMAIDVLEWVAIEFLKPKQEAVYTGTGSDYLDCVLGVGGFESFGPIEK